MANIELIALDTSTPGSPQLRAALSAGGDTYTVPGALSATPANQNITLSPTGTGTVTVAPDSTLTLGKASVTTSMPGNISYTGTLTGGTGAITIGTTQLVKDTSGNIGVGTASINGRLNVSTNNATGGVNINESTNSVATYGYITASHYTNGAFISTVSGSNPASDILRLGTGNTTRATIDASGNLGVGVSPSGSYKLEVSGSVNATSIQSTPIGSTTASTGKFTSVETTTGGVGAGTAPVSSAWVKTAAGSSSTAPIQLTSGSNLGTAAAGAIEYDGNAAYLTNGTTAGRGLLPAPQFVRLSSAYTTTSGSTALQQLFNATASGAIAVAGSTTYEFECVFGLSSLSSTSGTVSFGFGGSATLTSIWYTASCNKGNNMQGTNGTAATATTISASSVTTSANAIVKGIIQVNAGGTLIPSFAISVASAAVVASGSFFKLTAVGSSSVTTVGAWT